MKNLRNIKFLALLPLLAFSSLVPPAGGQQEKQAYYSEADFPAVKKYDTHVHVYTPDASLIRQAAADNFHLLDINGYLFPGAPPIAAQQAQALSHRKAFPRQVSFAATISVENFNDPGWQKETIANLKKAFAQGAVAVKVWKNIGMELKDAQGKFVMIDHPKFDPVLDFIAREKKTLLSHQGEPKNCWLPLEQMTVAGDQRYYARNPQYHMYLHPEYPSYEAQMKARDQMVAKHPDLKVVAVHLASLEWSVAEIAQRLDKYPNLAVDMAARIPHLHLQAAKDWQQVHDFFIKYQDRILYGSDITTTPENKDPAAVAKNAHAAWLRDWKFFVTAEELTNSNNQSFRGLHLPRAVVDKIYGKNAERWIPGIGKATL
jgi:Amidohydrolase